MSKVKSAARIVFQVLPGGTLKLRGYENPPTRDEAFALSRSFFENAESLGSEADDLQPLMWELQQQFWSLGSLILYRLVVAWSCRSVQKIVRRN